MKRYVVLSKYDLQALTRDKEVKIFIDGKEYFLCSDEYFTKEVLEKDMFKKIFEKFDSNGMTREPLTKNELSTIFKYAGYVNDLMNKGVKDE